MGAHSNIQITKREGKQECATISSLDRDEAAIEHFEVLDVHVGALDVRFALLALSLVFLDLVDSILLDLFKLLCHALNFRLKLFAAHALHL